MSDQVSRRVRAYRYMVQAARESASSPEIESDQLLADMLGIPTHELSWVKAGKINPSARMVTAFKRLVCPRIDESEVDSYLVEPFTNN